MGRQVATNGFDQSINYVWATTSHFQGSPLPTLFYDAFVPALGVLSYGTGGVGISCNIIGCTDPIPHSVIHAAMDGTAILAFDINLSLGTDGSVSKPQVARNSTPALADFAVGAIDTMTWYPHLAGDAVSFNWHQIALTEGAAPITHVVVSGNRTDADNLGLYLRRVGPLPNPWESGVVIGQAGYEQSFVITASRQSDRVAIAWSGGRGDGTEFGASVSRYNGQLSGKNDNDIYVMISEDAGVTWGATQNVTQRANADPGGWAPHAKLSILFNQADSLHVVWQAVEWVGYDATFNTRSRMFHWSENANAVRTAVDANWDPILCNGGDNTLNLDNPQLSACNNKLYLSYTQFAPVPLGKGDDCSERALTGDSLGAANGDIYVSISGDGGFTWDAPRNLTNTYTPQCDTLPGSPLPDCDSDVWHSVIRYGIDITGFDFIALTNLTDNLDASYTGADFLVAMYINDSDPGTALQSEGGWTDNMVKTVRFGCVEPIPSSILASSLPEASVFTIAELLVPTTDTTFDWILENIGNADITDLTITVTNSDPPGAITISGFGPTILSGANNSDTGVVSLNANGIPLGTATADITVDGSFVGAPKTFSLSYSLAAAPCCVAGGDVNGDSKVGIADVTFLIARIFAGGTAPECCGEADANGDGSVNIADVTYLIARIFAGGLPPVCGPAGLTCGA